MLFRSKELFDKLPLKQSLGSSDFPIVYEKGGSKIYNVGSLPNDTLENYLQESSQENIDEFKFLKDDSSSLLTISDTEKYGYWNEDTTSESSTETYKDKRYVR